MKELRIKDTRGLDATLKVKQVTIKYDYSSGNFYCLVMIERHIQELPVNDNSIGIDMGIKLFATCSDGQVFDNLRFMKQSASKLRISQRKLARQKKLARTGTRLNGK